MSNREKELRKQLEEEAEAWIKKEYERRFAIAKETAEQQSRETEHHLKVQGISDTSQIMSETQMSISMMRSELLSDVKFEAENWVEEELARRLKEEK